MSTFPIAYRPKFAYEEAVAGCKHAINAWLVASIREKRAISNARETIASVSFRGGDERVERPSSPNQSLLGF